MYTPLTNRSQLSFGPKVRRSWVPELNAWNTAVPLMSAANAWSSGLMNRGIDDRTQPIAKIHGTCQLSRFSNYTHKFNNYLLNYKFVANKNSPPAYFSLLLCKTRQFQVQSFPSNYSQHCSDCHIVKILRMCDACSTELTCVYLNNWWCIVTNLQWLCDITIYYTYDLSLRITQHFKKSTWFASFPSTVKYLMYTTAHCWPQKINVCHLCDIRKPQTYSANNYQLPITCVGLKSYIGYYSKFQNYKTILIWPTLIY